LYASPNIIQVIKSRKMKWAGHVAHMGNWEMHTVFWLEKLEGRNPLEDLEIYGKIIFE
jgi:hypothetical protein